MALALGGICMAGEESAGLAALARIEERIVSLDRRAESHSTKLEQIREGSHESALETQAALAEVKGSVQLGNQKLQTHEDEDDRRFQELQEEIRENGINGTPHLIAGQRHRQVAKIGGAAVGGGGMTLIILKILELLGR